LESDFDTKMVDALAAAEEKNICKDCIFFLRLPCPEEDWDKRDPESTGCECFEVEGDDCR
jgi:hypothetical protein